MDRHLKFINLAWKIAKALPPPKIMSGHARIASILVIRNDVIGVGINKNKSHPFQAKYGTNAAAVFVHAETAAILNALREQYMTMADISKATLYIARSRYRHGTKIQEFGLALPCEGCQRCIIDFGIKKVFYTNNKNTFEQLV